jgi:hypothetical protein
MLNFIKELFHIKSFEEKCREYSLPLPTDERWKMENEASHIYSFLDKILCIQKQGLSGFYKWIIYVSGNPLVYTSNRFNNKYGKLLDSIQTDRKLNRRAVDQRRVLSYIN